MKNRLQALSWMALLAVLTGAGCARVQARAKFKDGNKSYKEENFKQAITHYEKAVELDPNMAEAHFYLASSHHALYRPAKDTPENKAHLDTAIEHYKKSLELNRANSESRKKVKVNTVGALTGIYSEEPYRDYEIAHQYASQLLEDNPNDPKNLFAVANLAEKFGKIDEAEAIYKKVAEMNPSDPKACGALAAFYNKPLWEGRSKFEQAIDVLQRCAELDPKDPGGYQKVATFYWDKAYRDPLISDAQKEAYADKGLEAVDRALEIKPDYFDAIIYKGLLYRVKASVTKNPRLRQQYLDQAAALQKQGLEMKKEQAAAGASPAPGAEGAPPPR